MRTFTKKQAVLFATVCALALPTSAFASETVEETVREINAAVAAQPSAPKADPVRPVAPKVGSDLLSQGKVKLGLPATGQGRTVGGTTVFDAANSSGVQVAVQRAAGGTRALINIDSQDAPERFAFPVSGRAASLRQEHDGSVSILAADGGLLSAIAPAWARDAAGRSVPTHYEIDGTDLTQVVNHKVGAFAYGVTADPWWVPVTIVIAKCYQNRTCRRIMWSKGTRTAVSWALRHLF